MHLSCLLRCQDDILDCVVAIAQATISITYLLLSLFIVYRWKVFILTYHPWKI